MPKNKPSFKQHVKIVQHMLTRKFPGISFEVRVRKFPAVSIRDDYDRFIEVKFKPVDDKPTVADVEYYLRRFQNGEPDRKGAIFARSFWTNEDGFGVLALIRKKMRNGSSVIEERCKEPTENGPYWLTRFEIQKYKVIDSNDKPYVIYDED